MDYPRELSRQTRYLATKFIAVAFAATLTAHTIPPQHTRRLRTGQCKDRLRGQGRPAGHSTPAQRDTPSIITVLTVAHPSPPHKSPALPEVAGQAGLARSRPSSTSPRNHRQPWHFSRQSEQVPHSLRRFSSAVPSQSLSIRSHTFFNRACVRATNHPTSCTVFLRP